MRANIEKMDLGASPQLDYWNVGIMEYWVQKVFVLISAFRIIPVFRIDFAT
jgi:hypothetical protein